jgi:hypothetical protein
MKIHKLRTKTFYNIGPMLLRSHSGKGTTARVVSKMVVAQSGKQLLQKFSDIFALQSKF